MQLQIAAPISRDVILLKEIVLETGINAHSDWKVTSVSQTEGALIASGGTAPQGARAPRMSMHETTTYRWSLLDDVNAYRGAGIGAIGVWKPKLIEWGEEKGAELLRDSELTVSSLSYAGGFTGSDGASFREAVDEALEAVELAADIGAECLVLISGARAGHTRSHAQRLLRDALRELGDAAGERNLHLALQPMHRAFAGSTTFLTSLDSTLDALGFCNHSRVGMLLDLFHLWQEPDLCQRAAEAVEWIKLVAVSDWNAPPRHDMDRCLPGLGQAPLASLVQSLGAAGYRGFYDVQVQSEECWSLDYDLVLRHCQEAFQSLHHVGSRPEPGPEPARSVLS